MKKLSNTSFIKLISRLLILLAIAKIITLSLWWFLPSDGREAQNTQSLKPAYQRVDFRNMLKGKSKNTAKTAATNKVKSSSTSITNMILKGLYGKGSSGMAIVALKSSSKKTSVISVGESFKGYVLKTILKESVIFTKNTKEYILRMSESKKTSKSIASIVAVEPTNTVVPRKEINEYINNKKIYMERYRNRSL